MNTKQTERNDTGHDLVDATVILRPLGNESPVADSKTAIETVLQNAQSQTGLAPERFVIFENLNAFSVRAPARFLEAVGRASEVDHLMESDSSGPDLIAPVARRKVGLDAVTSLTGKSDSSTFDFKG